MKIGLFITGKKEGTLEVLKSLAGQFVVNNIDFIVCNEINSIFPELESNKFFHGVFENADEFRNNQVDYLISIGGDGTLLNTVLYVKETQIPVIGINLGKLGFLSNNPVNQIPEIISNLIDGKFTIESRSVIKLITNSGLFEDENYALNDFTIHKRDNSSLTTISAFLDDELLNTYWGDGIIVATPTGSTAYSMSCGGPIVSPNSNNFIITAVAPHNLNVRPVVVPDNVEISLKIEGKEKKYLVSLDSRYRIIDNSVDLRIIKAPFSINTIRFSGKNFSSVLREKLMWGKDNRNI